MVAGIWPVDERQKRGVHAGSAKGADAGGDTGADGERGSPEGARAEGIAIAQEMLAEVRGMVEGVQVSAPFGKYKAAAQVLGVV